MRSMRWLSTGVVLVLVSCGGGSSQSSETTEVVLSETTEVVSKPSVEEVIAGWEWEPSESLNTFRSLDVPVIQDSSRMGMTSTFSESGGRKLCDDLYSLSDFAAGSNQVKPMFLNQRIYFNWSQDLPLLAGKLGVVLEFIVFDASAAGPNQIISNYDRFQASHVLPCKGKWEEYLDEELESCRIPAVPGIDSECASKLKSPYSSVNYETIFAFESDYESLSGKTPNISAISSHDHGNYKLITLDNLVYLPVIDRAVLLTVKVFDESQSFNTNELNETAMDLAFAIWDDVEANLTAYFITNSG